MKKISKNERKYSGKLIKKAIWKKREIEYVSGEILIKIRPGKERDSAFQEKLFSGDLKGAKIKKDFNRFGMGVIEAGDDVDIIELCKVLEKDLEIEYAEPNMIDEVFITTPDDTNYSLQWALPLIDAPNAWDLERGDSSVMIAILDSGIPMTGTPAALSHPDLNDNTRFILGYDYVNNDNDPLDDHGHGTHVTGIASAETDNNTGVAGLNWGSIIYVIKVFNNASPLPTGSHQNFYNGVIEAVDHAVAHNLRLVINYSGGGTPSNTKEQAIIYADDRNCLIVAAAGNHGGAVIYPAAYSSTFDNVIAVSATNSADVFENYSNRGAEINVAAPGTGIYSTMPNYNVTANNPPNNISQNYGYMSGTSMATPFVSALAALILSVNNSLTPAQVRDIIENSAIDLGNPGWDQLYGYGRIDAFDSIEDATGCAYSLQVVQCFARREFGLCTRIEFGIIPCTKIELLCTKLESLIDHCPRFEVICLKEFQMRDPREIYFKKKADTDLIRHSNLKNLKHIRPLTRKRPLSHKKRYT